MSNTKEIGEIELIEQHKGLVKIIVRGFRNSGINEQDLFQEGLIALLRAIQTYDPEFVANPDDKRGRAKFETYATRVIKNRFIDIMRREREVTGLLTDQATTGATIEDEWGITEKSEIVKNILDTECTQIEKAIFKSYARGHSYDEICDIFDIPKKKIDNTIQKIRNKIKIGISG